MRPQSTGLALTTAGSLRIHAESLHHSLQEVSAMTAIKKFLTKRRAARLRPYPTWS
jgi:hypothetical protein